MSYSYITVKGSRQLFCSGQTFRINFNVYKNRYICRASCCFRRKFITYPSDILFMCKIFTLPKKYDWSNKPCYLKFIYINQPLNEINMTFMLKRRPWSFEENKTAFIHIQTNTQNSRFVMLVSGNHHCFIICNYHCGNSNK